MNLAETIRQLQSMKTESPIGDDTAVVLCIDDSGIEYQPIDRVTLDRSGGEGSALALIHVGDIPGCDSGNLTISQHGNPDLSRAVQVVQCDCGVEICIAGYGRPIYLELDKTGEPVCYISAEADSDDISHTISLAGAKENPTADT